MRPLWKTVWSFHIKLKTEFPYDLAILLLGIDLEKTLNWKDTCTPTVHAVLFTRAKTWKQHKCPSTDEWIKKIWYIYTMEYYSAIKKNERMPFTEMCGPRDYHTKWCKSERQILYDITYMSNRKHDTNELIYETEIDSQRKQTCGCQRRGEVGTGINRCKLLYIYMYTHTHSLSLSHTHTYTHTHTEINHNVLLCSLGNYSISCDKPEWKRISKTVYKYTVLNHFSVQKKSTQHNTVN